MSETRGPTFFVGQSAQVVPALHTLCQLTTAEIARDFVEPEAITSHYVVVGGRRFPPKQAISAVTGLDRADFTTHQARRTLLRLGFAAGRRSRRRSASPRTAPPGSADSPPVLLVDRLRSFEGQWVAIQDDDVIHAAATPHELVGWLARQGQRADSMFRMPADDVAANGLAPL